MVRRTKTNATAPRGTDRQDRSRSAVAGLKGVAHFNAPLKEYTSFHIGGPADVLVEPADTEDIVQLVIQAHTQKLPIFVLGGTNVLVRDKGIRGVVVNLAKLRAIKEERGSVLYAEGGVGMPTLIGYAIRRSLTGDTCLAATCARCGVVFRDGREHGLNERQEFDPELGQLFIAHYCPACDAVREAA